MNVSDGAEASEKAERKMLSFSIIKKIPHRTVALRGREAQKVQGDTSTRYKPLFDLDLDVTSSCMGSKRVHVTYSPPS